VLSTIFVGGSVSSFAEIFSQIQKTLGATQRVRELLEEQPEALREPNAERRKRGTRNGSPKGRRPPLVPDATTSAERGKPF
jgi:ATP-binding cassette subfamily B protein